MSDEYCDDYLGDEQDEELLEGSIVNGVRLCPQCLGGGYISERHLCPACGGLGSLG